MRAKLANRKTRFANRAWRSYWSVHVEAWLRSGVSRHRYCREHGLLPRTMSKWIKHLETPLPTPSKLKRRREKSWVRPKHVRVPAVGTTASRAFWLMHVDAQQASGLTFPEYANAHHLNVRRLRREVREFLRNPEAPNWRELMHPANRPPVRY